MYLKSTRSGARQYLQLVEAYRDPANGQPKQRHLATLGRVDQLTAAAVDGLINGLLKVRARPGLERFNQGLEAEHLTFEPALQLGDVWALSELWQQLRLGPAITASVRTRRYRMEVARRVRLLVINRLSDPDSKLGVLRWLERVYVPGSRRQRVTHQQVRRAMDALITCQAHLQQQVAATLGRQCTEAMEVVFYDLTTSRVQGEGEVEEDLRQYGDAKGGYGVDRQFAVGVVQTAAGLPVSHEVFEGHVSETTPVRGMVERLCARFPIQRLVVIADRGLLSLDTLEALEGISLPGGRWSILWRCRRVGARS